MEMILEEYGELVIGIIVTAVIIGLFMGTLIGQGDLRELIRMIGDSAC